MQSRGLQRTRKRDERGASARLVVLAVAAVLATACACSAGVLAPEPIFPPESTSNFILRPNVNVMESSTLLLRLLSCSSAWTGYNVTVDCASIKNPSSVLTLGTALVLANHTIQLAVTSSIPSTAVGPAFVCTVRGPSSLSMRSTPMHFSQRPFRHAPRRRAPPPPPPPPPQSRFPPAARSA